jgi:ABC-type bacteriocin/lantibiotic exporter with double-glycine peptidase domain
VALAPACRGLAVRPTEMSEEAVLLTVPMVPQDDLYECGLASISALCQYHGLVVPQDERAELVALANEKEGLSGAEIRTALERLGLEVFLFPGTLDRTVSGVYHHLDQGRPLLVMISVEPGKHHYCLLTGYDPIHGNLFLSDPRRGSLVLPAEAFETLWARSGHFTLLAAPRPAVQEDGPSSPASV